MVYNDGKEVRPGDIFTTAWGGTQRWVISDDCLHHRPFNSVSFWHRHSVIDTSHWLLIERRIKERKKTGFAKFVIEKGL